MKLKDPTLLKTSCLINGKWTDSADGKTIDVHAPGFCRVSGQAARWSMLSDLTEKA